MPTAKRRKPASKKSTRRKVEKDLPVEHELPGGFWRQIIAILMIALATFFVFTWFGQGGNVLNTIHQFFTDGIGFGVYSIPVLLVYLAIRILRSDNNRVAIPVYIASIMMVFWITGIAAIPGYGGIVGKWLNGIFTNVLNEAVVVIIYLVLIVITLLFILQISPVSLLKGTKNLAEAEKKEVADKASQKKANKYGSLEIKVNSGVETMSEDTPPAHRKGLSIGGKKSAPPAPAKPEEKALVAVNDADWKMPPVNLLTKKQSPADAGNIQQKAHIIKDTFAEFGIDVEMADANVGPRITQYTLKAPGGVNLSKIAARDKEIAYKLGATTVRIEAPIPGTQLIGVEVPNTRAASVSLRSIIESDEWRHNGHSLSFAIGKDISGKPVVADLPSMRHLLIAGTTGSGKSVMTNTIIMSLLFRNSPSDMRLIIVDPKQVEMVAYNNIPHLLTPIITDTTKAFSAMKWAANEMDLRYKLMAEHHVKNISDYNKMIQSNSAPRDADGEAPSKMPYIVIVIDEMSDLMMQAGKELEPLIVRIAQLGRAAGMHLVLATQKPIVKVITGLIKGNIPSRIAFRVLSSMESRIILDQSGADKLLGQGDMLLSTEQTTNGPERIQGAWTPDEDIEKVTNFLREQRPPAYNDEVISQAVAIKGAPGGGADMDGMGRKFDPSDPLVRKAVEISLANGKFSTGMLQTRLSKGHGWVSGLGYWLEEIGAVGPTQGTKPRELLISSMEDFDTLINAGE